MRCSDWEPCNKFSNGDATYGSKRGGDYLVSEKLRAEDVSRGSRDRRAKACSVKNDLHYQNNLPWSGEVCGEGLVFVRSKCLWFLSVTLENETFVFTGRLPQSFRYRLASLQTRFLCCIRTDKNKQHPPTIATSFRSLHRNAEPRRLALNQTTR